MVPANLLALAGNDRDRANALYMKMRLRQEFPQTYYEARNGITITGVDPNTGATIKPNVPPKQFYAQALANAPGTPNATAIPLPVWESAICLYLALSQTRRGAAFNADDIGAGSTATVAGTTAAGANYSFKYFVDAWGNPIGFERWPNQQNVTPAPSPPPTANVPWYGTTNNILAELSGAPYATQLPSTPAGNTDLLDPLSKLYNQPPSSDPNVSPSLQPNAGWSNATAAATALHPFDGLNRAPIIYSAGPDQIYNQTTVTSFDDIYSFRLLVEGQRGN
jgi:hypothetical protein